ncbi:hypothetical protein B0H19DRAFT_1154888, partial [Mycena capillaripes]
MRGKTRSTTPQRASRLRHTTTYVLSFFFVVSLPPSHLTSPTRLQCSHQPPNKRPHIPTTLRILAQKQLVRPRLLLQLVPQPVPPVFVVALFSFYVPYCSSLLDVGVRLILVGRRGGGRAIRKQPRLGPPPAPLPPPGASTPTGARSSLTEAGCVSAAR